MKYIFMVGAPGSKWSGVNKSIYYSSDIDRSDYSENRTYYHNARGVKTLMHLGAYFDPGMEFGRLFDKLETFTKAECEQMFDQPFSGKGVRIIKSHVFAHKIDFLKKHWPECPIVLVHAPDKNCLHWWIKCGEFNITYPNYAEYYKDLPTMAKIIEAQNADILAAMETHQGIFSYDNRTACLNLHIGQPPERYSQNYSQEEITVKILSFKKDIK